MLRGYDPLKEIYHWNLIILTIAGISVFMSFLFTPILLTVISPLDRLISIIFLFTFLSIFLSFAIIPPIASFLIYSHEKKKRDALRRAALKEDPPLSDAMQSGLFAAWSLPIHLERHLSKSTIRPGLTGALVLAALVGINIVGMLGLWEIPTVLSMIPYLAGTAIPGFVMVLFRPIHGWIVEHYLHPSLQIDHDGITATYGRDTVSMSWQAIRYVALVDGKVLGKDANAKQAPNREVIEFSDGENIICWPTKPLSPQLSHVLWSNTVKLSMQDYATFNEQFAALVIAKSGRPLHDFRLLKDKKKKGSTPKQQMPYMQGASNP